MYLLIKYRNNLMNINRLCKNQNINVNVNVKCNFIKDNLYKNYLNFKNNKDFIWKRDYLTFNIIKENLDKPLDWNWNKKWNEDDEKYTLDLPWNEDKYDDTNNRKDNGNIKDDSIKNDRKNNDNDKNNRIDVPNKNNKDNNALNKIDEAFIWSFTI